ncbi:MAG TPA: beta-galactosidase [Blastocatellia bacterium]|nr:beta-galactosidase [Blastocatellia bacterium]
MRPSMIVALVAVLLTCSAVRAQSPPQDLRGVYVYSGNVATISATYAQTVTQSLSVTGMDGIVLVIGWNSIEPALGQYQFGVLDQWMSQAISSGKKVDLAIVAGNDTPAWLFQQPPNGAGATPVNFTISPHSGATGQCDSETIAAPWDTAFLSQWDSMLASVAAHLKAMKSYNAVTVMRLTGINRTTDELRLPAETAQSTGLACVSNSLTTWQQAGYKPSLLLQGWDAITNSFQKSFRDKSFSVAIIPENPFPRIAEDGSIIQGPAPDENQPVLMLASQKFSGHLVVQFNFLMPGEAASPAVIQAAQTLGTLAAFQTNNYFGSTGQGAACSEPVTNPTPCTDATYLEMLQTGIYPLGQSDPLRAQYIEVFPANANAFPDDIEQAHTELDPDTLTLELAKQKANGKLTVRVIGRDPKATLSISAFPQPPDITPILLGNMTKTDPNGNEFFIVAKGLPKVQSVQIASSSGGELTASVKQP